MKKIFLLALAFLNFNCWALQFEYNIGGVTPHLKTPPNHNLCNELVSGSNIIFNKTNSYRMESKDFGGGALVGENSYCKPIWGATSYYKMYKTEAMQINGTIGFYHFETAGFDFSERAYFAHVKDFYFVPIAGVEVNFNLYDSKDFHIKMVNLITPVISNHSVGFYFDI
jgi:hypothetical protein